MFSYCLLLFTCTCPLIGLKGKNLLLCFEVSWCLIKSSNCFFYYVSLKPCLHLWRMYKNAQVIAKDDNLDYGANFAHMLGYDSPAVHELMRLYITIHRWAILISFISDMLGWAGFYSMMHLIIHYSPALQWSWRWEC